MDAGAEQVARAAAAGAPYLLLTDAGGKPLGWVAPQDAAGGADKVAVGSLLPYGRPFAAGRESLRDALDCAVLSPTGWAVAVDEQGAVAGVVSQEAIGAAIRSAHADQREDGPAVPVRTTKAEVAT